MKSSEMKIKYLECVCIIFTFLWVSTWTTLVNFWTSYKPRVLMSWLQWDSEI